jgi:hypothetical protein
MSAITNNMSKKELAKNSLKTALLLFVFCFLPIFASAQVIREQLGVEFLNDFVLEPAKNEVFINPGESSVERLSVINRMNKQVTFQVEVEDIVGSDKSYEQVKLLGNEKGPYSLKDFLIPEITEFTLNPGEKITIPIRVQLPETAEVRGYYGALIVSARGDSRDIDNTTGADGLTKIVTRLGSIFLVRINGDVNESSYLWDFKTVGPAKMFYSNHPTGFEVAIKNDGNVHLVHYGEIKIKNMFGKEVNSLPVNAFFSLPDSTRYREIEWPKSFSFGFYTAELSLYQGFDGENGFINSSISFVVVSWQILIAIILLTALILVITRYLKKNFKIERKA